MTTNVAVITQITLPVSVTHLMFTIFILSHNRTGMVRVTTYHFKGDNVKVGSISAAADSTVCAALWIESGNIAASYHVVLHNTGELQNRGLSRLYSTTLFDIISKLLRWNFTHWLKSIPIRSWCSSSGTGPGPSAATLASSYGRGGDL